MLRREFLGVLLPGAWTLVSRTAVMDTHNKQIYNMQYFSFSWLELTPGATPNGVFTDSCVLRFPVFGLYSLVYMRLDNVRARFNNIEQETTGWISIGYDPPPNRPLMGAFEIIQNPAVASITSFGTTLMIDKWKDWTGDIQMTGAAQIQFVMSWNGLDPALTTSISSRVTIGFKTLK